MKRLPWRGRIPKLPKWAQNYIGKIAIMAATLLALREGKRCAMCGRPTTGFNVLCRDCRAWYRMRRNEK